MNDYEQLKADYERLRGLYLREILPSSVDAWVASLDLLDSHPYVLRSVFELGASWARRAAMDGQRNNNVSEFIDFEIAKRDIKSDAEKDAFRKGSNYIFDLVLV